MSENIVETMTSNMELKTKKMEELCELINSAVSKNEEFIDYAEKILSDNRRMVCLCLDLLGEHYQM